MKRLCVIGDPVEHSLSPVMHNAALKALNLDAMFEYFRLRVPEEELGAFIGSMRGGNIVGASVTMPHKEAVIPFLDGLTEEARLCQAVNTVFTQDGSILGHNTDGEGLFRALRESGVTISGKKILMMGAGGAAKAIALTLAKEQPTRLFIINRNVARAEELALLIPVSIQVETGGRDVLKTAAAEADIIINATSVGMNGQGNDISPVPVELIRSDMTVMDIVYNPVETRLLSDAKAKGAKTVDGLGMLVHQGAAQFELFTGAKAPTDIMRKAIIRILSEG